MRLDIAILRARTGKEEPLERLGPVKKGLGLLKNFLGLVKKASLSNPLFLKGYSLFSTAPRSFSESSLNISPLGKLTFWHMDNSKNGFQFALRANILKTLRFLNCDWLCQSDNIQKALRAGEGRKRKILRNPAAEPSFPISPPYRRRRSKFFEGIAMNREDELAAFKREIDLRLFAAEMGFEADKSRRWGNCEVMRNGSEKIIISMGENGVWMYWNATEQTDAGNIIDFVQNRQNLNLGEVRKELRPWLGESAKIPVRRGGEFDQPLLPITKEKADMYGRLATMQMVKGSQFLNQVRSLPEAITAGQRFAGRIYQDQRSNAVFPHYDREGLCGYEIKNAGFTGFSPGGSKGLWCSRTTEEDDALVIGEAAIDLLSFAALHPSQTSRYVSTGGAVSPTGLELIARAATKMPKGSKIILAVDHDEAGEKLAGEIKALLCPVVVEACLVSVQMPQGKGEDWNDVLRSSEPENSLSVADSEALFNDQERFSPTHE